MRDADWWEEFWWRFFEAIRLAGWIIAPLLAVTIVLALATCVGAAETCLPSAEVVRAKHPGAWPSWTGRMEGHRGEQCWFPTERGKVRYARHEQKPRHVTETVGQAPRAQAVAEDIPQPPAAADPTFADRFAVGESTTTDDSLHPVLLVKAAAMRLLRR